MKSLKLLLLLALAVGSLRGQTTTTTTPTPVWFTAVPVADQSLSTTMAVPAGTTYRFGDTVNNKWTTPVTTTAAVTLVDYADGTNGRSPDPDPGTPKEFDIQETSKPQSITVVINGASSVVTVPAMSYPAITFQSGVSYRVTVGSLPSATSLLVLAVTLTDSNNPSNTITFTCTYGNTAITPASGSTPATEQALESCVPK